MKCNLVKKSLNAFVDGELSASMSAEIAMHLEKCEKCNMDYKALKQISNAMCLSGFVEPPDSLKDSILMNAFQDESVCKGMSELFPVFLDDELETEQSESVIYHTKHCVNCAKELQDMKSIIFSIQSIESVEVPNDLYESILMSANNTKKSWFINPLSLAEWFNTAAFKTVSAAALCIVFFALALNFAHFKTTNQTKVIALKPTLDTNTKTSTLANKINMLTANPIVTTSAKQVLTKSVYSRKQVSGKPVIANAAKMVSIKTAIKQISKSLIETNTNSAMIVNENLNAPTEEIEEQTTVAAEAKIEVIGEKFVKVSSIISNKYDTEQKLKDYKMEVAFNKPDSGSLVRIKF